MLPNKFAINCCTLNAFVELVMSSSSPGTKLMFFLRSVK